MQRSTILTGLAGITGAALLTCAALAATQAAGDGAAPAEPPAHGAHSPHGGPGMGFMIPGLMPPHMLEHMADQLGLSTEQRQTIKGLFEQARPGFQQLHEQLHVNAELLMNTRPDDANYTSVVANVSQASSGLAGQFVLQASQLRSQVFGVLTADQQTKLVQLQAQMKEHMKEHMQKGHGTWHGAAPPAGPPAAGAPMPN